MKQNLKIDYKKSILTLLTLGIFGYFSYFGPLDRKDLESSIATIENEFFAPKLVSAYKKKQTKEVGLISEGHSYVLGEYGLVKPFSENRIKEAGLISFHSEMGTSLHNSNWAKEIAERLDEKYEDRAEVIVKMEGDLCVAEIYQHGRLQSLYFENMLHNSVQGFSGPIYMGIEMTLQGRLKEVSYITSKETESYLRKVLRSSYLEQYENLNTRDDTHVIDAMSGATITTRAMAEGVTEAFQRTAPYILASYYDYDVAAFKVEAVLTYWWIVHIIIIAGIFLFALLPQIKKTKKTRLAVFIFTMIYIGFGMNASFTYITFLMPFMGTEVSLFLGLYALITLLSAIWGKNVYCSYVCPFGAAQMISLKYSPFKSKKLFITNKQAEYIRYAITILLFLGFVFGYKRFGNYELFPDLFSTEFSSYWFYIALAFIGISIKYPMLWCRVACPTGCLLDSLKTISKTKKK